MRIFVIASPQKGSGKTMIAMNLTEFLRQHGTTVLIDTDLKRRGFEWAQLHGKQFHFEHYDLNSNDDKTLDARVQQLQNKFDFMVVDIDGADTHALRSVLKHADKLIIPNNADPISQQMLAELIELAIGMGQFNSKLKVYSLLNQIPKDEEAQAIMQSQALLEDIPDSRFFNTILYQDDAFHHAMLEGKTIWEFDPETAEHFQRLGQEILTP